MRQSPALLLTSVAMALISLGCSSGDGHPTLDESTPTEPSPAATQAEPDPVPPDPTASGAAVLAPGDVARRLPLSRCDLPGAPVASIERLPLAADPTPATGCVDLLLPVWPHVDPFAQPE